MKTATLFSALVAAMIPLACQEAAPTAPPAHATAAATANATGMEMFAISGTVGYVSDGAPVRVLVTPGGICRYWDFEGTGVYEGDVQGLVLYHRQVNIRCDGGRLLGSGLVEGNLTWNGRSGPVTGEWTTNCKPDDSLMGIACDGTMNFRGSGGLEGVQIHTKWGPGWWPFPYTGTVFSK